MAGNRQLNHQSVLDGLRHGVLLFDSSDHLVTENLAAQGILGADLKLIRANGWHAASSLFNTRRAGDAETVDSARAKARESARPVRFFVYLSGEYTPCSVSYVHGAGGEGFTMITIDQPDWSALSELMGKFREEVLNAAAGTAGHSELILHSLKQPRPKETVEQLGRRISGFASLIAIYNNRLERLTRLMERLEIIRTGRLPEVIREERQRIDLGDFMEDFIESLDERSIVDPEAEKQDYRGRIITSVPGGLVIAASPQRLTAVLQDVLRNAIMYSLKASQINLMAYASGGNQAVQIDVEDEGYGIRAKEFEQVFTPFIRAKQPQILAEFGYGLSLYLCKQEIEAMNGKIWFSSEEGVGTKFSFKLPMWAEEPPV
jgi:signal transduction histidine kinase